MHRRSKIDLSLKVELVEKYLRDEIGLNEAVRLAGLSDRDTTSFKQWVNIYRAKGPAGLLDQKQNTHYSREVKLQAVHDYLDGKGSLIDIAGQYGLRSKKQLQNWLKEYNAHGEIKCRGSGGGSPLYRQRSHGGILGHTEARNVLWQTVYFQERPCRSYRKLPRLL